jgi:hypothetical protein
VDLPPLHGALPARQHVSTGRRRVLHFFSVFFVFSLHSAWAAVCDAPLERRRTSAVCGCACALEVASAAARTRVSVPRADCSSLCTIVVVFRSISYVSLCDMLFGWGEKGRLKCFSTRSQSPGGQAGAAELHRCSMALCMTADALLWRLCLVYVRARAARSWTQRRSACATSSSASSASATASSESTCSTPSHTFVHVHG